MRNVVKSLVIGSVAGATIGFVLDRNSDEPGSSTNVWKGLAVGGGAGAAVGIVLDQRSKPKNPIAQALAEADLAARAAELRERAMQSEMLHLAAERANELRGRAANSDVVHLAADRATELRELAAKSDVVNIAADRAREAAQVGSGVLQQANEAISDLGARSLALVD